MMLSSIVPAPVPSAAAHGKPLGATGHRGGANHQLAFKPVGNRAGWPPGGYGNHHRKPFPAAGHGMFRDIPYVLRLANGRRVAEPPEIMAVNLDGKALSTDDVERP